MPYYSIRLTGGTVSKARDVMQELGGRYPDHTDNPTTFLLERDYGIEKMRNNLSGRQDEFKSIEVEEVDEQVYNWRKYQ